MSPRVRVSLPDLARALREALVPAPPAVRAIVIARVAEALRREGYRFDLGDFSRAASAAHQEERSWT